ncbi:helix-turn-helix domain-containing protein [Kocuria palustris]|uniref:helix-turn-helix domain-containing protein n=1 Tax=Kocuria palustris TaxID=71999 RepID=UPI0009ED2B5E
MESASCFCVVITLIVPLRRTLVKYFVPFRGTWVRLAVPCAVSQYADRMIENSDMDWAAAVGDEVRAWLARTRHSQAQLALHLGLAKSAITRRVRGEYPFAITELIEIAQWLDISLEQLLGPTILRAQKSPRSDMVTTGAEEKEWALWGSNPRPMD